MIICGRAPAPAVVHSGAAFKLTWFPYELKLAHTFTVATWSRDVTPGVQVRLEFDGVTGYGEAAMPQYLGQSVESVVSFLSKVNLSGINIKLMKCGGMREAWRMLNMVRSLGMRVMLGCMTEMSCAVAAAAQLSPAADFADLDGNLLITNDLFSGVEVVNGHLLLPDCPGLGLLDRRFACGKTQ